MNTRAQESGLPVRIAKRAGKLLLGVFFWWMILVLAFDLFQFSLAILRWQSPDWEMGGWSVLCTPHSDFIWHRLGAGISFVATAAIGWLYVFRHRLRAVWVAIALWGLGTFAIAVTGLGFAHPPSDFELVERFEREQEAFDRLAAMWSEDARAHAASPSAASGSGVDLSETRQEEYRQVARKLSLDFGTFRLRDPQIKGIMIGNGELELMGCQVVKGYAYAEREPAPLVESLDDISEKAWGLTFKRLKGNWYLYYSRTNY